MAEQSAQETDNTGALAGLLVIELGDEATQGCGKFLADMGATVIKVEPPEGAAARHRGPYLDGHEGDLNASIFFWTYNTNKESVTLDLSQASARATLDALLAKADVLLEDYPVGYLESIGLGYDQLAAKYPRLVYTSITPFGQTGPLKDWLGSDMVAWAMGGAMQLVGYSDHSLSPLLPQGDLACQLASQWAGVGVMAALTARDNDGLGDHVDVSLQEAVALTVDGYATGPFEYENRILQRDDLWNKAATKEGGVIVAQMLNVSVAKWQAFKDWLIEQGEAGELADMPASEYEINRPIVVKAVERLAQTGRWDPHELCKIGQGFGFTWMHVNSARELVRDEQLRARGFFQEVEHPELGRTFEYAGAGAEWSEGGWSMRRRPPLLGEDNESRGIS